jgi:predicted ABC-type ATPase
VRGIGQIVIIAGPNGAGKTTFAQKLLALETQNFNFINADQIAASLDVAGAGQSNDIRAGRLMLAQLRESVELGEDIMLETTLANRTWAHHMPDWKVRGYHIVLYYLRLASADAAVARVRRRVAAGGHSIPEVVVRRRFDRSLSALERYKAIVDEWYVYDSFDDTEPVLADAWNK